MPASKTPSSPAALLASLLVIVALAPPANAGPGTGPPAWNGATDALRLPVPDDHGDDWDPAVAVSGDLAAVGDADGSEVWVYERAGPTWRRVGHLPPDGGPGPDAFGAAVDVDEGRVLVGAPGDDVEAPDGSYGGTNAGSAYLYARDGSGAWTLEHRFLGDPEPGTEDYLGRGVALQGDVVAVGSPGIVSGDVHVFRKDADGGWRQEARLLGRIFDGLGTGLDLDGEADALLAGAPGLSGALAFAHENGSWQETGELAVPSDADEYWAGWDVAVDGGVAAIGARESGAAWTFERTSDGWSSKATISGPAGASSAFGRSVALDGPHLAVGDPGGSGSSPEGSVTFYRQAADGSWTRSGSVVPDGASAGDEVGVDVALDGDTLVAGSRDAGGPGAADASSAFAVSPDGDADGLADWREAALGTDPRDPDTDDDGLEDGPERETHGSDPLDPDTDGDLHMDLTEVRRGSDPADPISVPLPGGGSTPSTGVTHGRDAPVTDDQAPVR